MAAADGLQRAIQAAAKGDVQSVLAYQGDMHLPMLAAIENGQEDVVMDIARYTELPLTRDYLVRVVEKDLGRAFQVFPARLYPDAPDALAPNAAPEQYNPWAAADSAEDILWLALGNESWAIIDSLDDDLGDLPVPEQVSMEEAEELVRTGSPLVGFVAYRMLKGDGDEDVVKYLLKNTPDAHKIINQWMISAAVARSRSPEFKAFLMDNFPVSKRQSSTLPSGLPGVRDQVFIEMFANMLTDRGYDTERWFAQGMPSDPLEGNFSPDYATHALLQALWEGSDEGARRLTRMGASVVDPQVFARRGEDDFRW